MHVGGRRQELLQDQNHQMEGREQQEMKVEGLVAVRWSGTLWPNPERMET